LAASFERLCGQPFNKKSEQKRSFGGRGSGENAPDGDWEVCFGEDARRARIDFEYPPFVDENGKEIV
jgi:hypothetical protein